jgi:hypothetical protein
MFSSEAIVKKTHTLAVSGTTGGTLFVSKWTGGMPVLVAAAGHGVAVGVDNVQARIISIKKNVSPKRFILLL